MAKTVTTTHGPDAYTVNLAFVRGGVPLPTGSTCSGRYLRIWGWSSPAPSRGRAWRPRHSVLDEWSVGIYRDCAVSPISVVFSREGRVVMKAVGDLVTFTWHRFCTWVTGGRCRHGRSMGRRQKDRRIEACAFVLVMVMFSLVVHRVTLYAESLDLQTTLLLLRLHRG